MVYELGTHIAILIKSRFYFFNNYKLNLRDTEKKLQASILQTRNFQFENKLYLAHFKRELYGVFQ